ncbi:hypothetical protein [Neisseria meningitidis]|uniref:hypothetical protein n=1 Tax=Neisseria meningitidis TaxID=487 RepID=UPI0016116DA8|nr:hypothetical protein [Neisseria meningitidis]
MRLSLCGCFYFTFSFIWVWFEEAGDYRFLSAVPKIVSFSADFRHFFIGVGYLYWHGAGSYTHLRAHETGRKIIRRLLLEKQKKKVKPHLVG